MRLNAPAALRNQEPIAAVLRRVLPAEGRVLEIAAGSGQHAVFMSSQFPALEWQPADRDSDALESIAAWRSDSSSTRLQLPKRLDVTESEWWKNYDGINAILNINMIHISPWTAAIGLMTGAGQLLDRGELFYLYGPFFGAAETDAPSNQSFDRSLQSRDERWGVRQLTDVIALAAEHGLEHEETIAMPANNFSVIFRKR